MKIVMSDSKGCYEVEFEEGAFVSIIPETRAEYDAMASCGAQYHPLMVKHDDDDRALGLNEVTAADHQKLQAFADAADWHAEIVGRTDDDKQIECEMRMKPTFLIFKRDDVVAQTIRCMPDTEDEEDTPGPVMIMTHKEHADFLHGFIAVGIAAAMDQNFMNSLTVEKA